MLQKFTKPQDDASNLLNEALKIFQYTLYLEILEAKRELMIMNFQLSP